VSFAVGADLYDRFMGRYAVPLAPGFADLAAVDAGRRVLDVGCGPGALTAELVRRLGPSAVSAVDPSEPFVAAARQRHPGVDVQRATAEELPFEDRVFDAALAQLVVHFMTRPVEGLREMARVTRKDGVVAASVWDHAGGQGPLSLYWQAVRELEESTLSVSVEHPSFEEWWEPYTLGVGPAGVYVAGLNAEMQAQLRDRCRAMLPPPPFTVTAVAWAARGLA